MIPIPVWRQSAAAALACAVLGACTLSGQQKRAVLVRMKSGEATALVSALKSQGWQASLAEPADAGQGAASMWLNSNLVVLEAQGELSADTLAGLKSFVQRGGSLLIGLPQHPGIAPTQLAFLMPTTAWMTQADFMSRPLTFSPIKTGAADPDMFGAARQPSLDLPYFFPIRPVSAVERGIARYDRYNLRTKNYPFGHPPDTFYWTRPLLNREWKVRLQGNDRPASPLLITGRYGAGRVAVFASTLAGDGASLEALWKPVIAWLTEPAVPAEREPAAGAVEISTKPVAAPNVLHLTLKNRSTAPLSLQVIGRILTWEGAYIGDRIEHIEVTASGSADVDLAMPSPSLTGYQAIDFRDAFTVRLGVLSKSGATLLAEQTVPIDLSPSTGLDLTTDNLYRVNSPYPTTPGVDGYPQLQNRMGEPVAQYAYPPSATVHVTATITNGTHNLAPMAAVTDETSPGNPSVVALADSGARGNKGPRDDFNGYGSWTGRASVENVLRLHFPVPVTITGVTLLGGATNKHGELAHNPGAVVVQCDGRTVLKKNDLDGLFVQENGLVRLSFEAVKATDLVVRLPWVETPPPTVKGKRTAPALGEIEIEGSEEALPAELRGNATLVLRNAMTATETVVGSKDITIPPGGAETWAQAFQLPKADTAFYQLQLRFAGQARSVPILAIQPARTLESIEVERPPGEPVGNFVTTKGFRNAFTLDTGTQDSDSAWQTPDDLIWAYSHQAKQVDGGRRSWANWLYVTDSDMRHYSTPWTLFDNGEAIFDQALPNLMSGMERQHSWSTSKKVLFGFGDRWDSGPSLPSMYGWQELVAFDEYLRANGKPGLAGTTHDELNRDVNRNHAAEWALWHEHRYVDTVEMLRTAFAAKGKELVISGQGIPMASNADAAILSRTVRGMSSDNTWGMEGESVSFTTGRQLADQAFNPEWKLNFNVVWGYDSTTLNNSFWYSPVGTTEPSRRHWYDSAWRGIVDDRGTYTSSFSFGYGNNGGDAWTMGLNDYQQAFNASERFSLIYPEAPLGAGLIVSSSPVDSPESALFSGGGMGPDGNSEALVHRVATTFQRLTDAGLSIPFTSNINAVIRWNGSSPLILQDLGTTWPKELEELKTLAGRGTRIAAFAGHAPLTPGAAALFGVAADGTAVHAHPAGAVGSNTLLANGNLLYIPFPADSLTPEMSLTLAPILQRWLDLPVLLPAGTVGYGFMSGGRTMVVVEDWLEQARELSIRIRATGKSAHAIELNNHNSLSVLRDGKDWVVTLPIRPGDGEVVVLEQGDPSGN
jgi:hypothetical protein